MNQQKLPTAPNIKRPLNRFKFLIGVASLLWITETVTFLLIDGWHLKPKEGSMEILCDGVVSILLLLSIYYFMVSAVRTITYVSDVMDSDDQI